MATSRHVPRRRRTARRRTRVPSATDWIAPWIQMREIAATAPLVIGYRTGRMLTGGWPPSARDRREYTRMWQEKVQAFTRAATAALTAPPGPVAAGRALTPLRRRVRGDARRVSRGRAARRGRPAAGQRAGLARHELNLKLMVPRRVPAHPMARCPRA